MKILNSRLNLRNALHNLCVFLPDIQKVKTEIYKNVTFRVVLSAYET